MNYSKNTLKNKNKIILRNIIISWVVILILGILIGFGISNMKKDSKKVEDYKLSEVELFGIVDSEKSNWTSSGIWKNGSELGFIPLEIELDEEVQEFIYCLSQGYNIDYSFVMGLIKTESTFQPNIISTTNDYGLMQINKVNHTWLKKELGITDFLDPYQNIRSGLYILRNLFEKYEDPEKVLMAYNMGESGAKKLWDKGVYETGYTTKTIKHINEIKNYMDERIENHE